MAWLIVRSSGSRRRQRRGIAGRNCVRRSRGESGHAPRQETDSDRRLMAGDEIFPREPPPRLPVRGSSAAHADEEARFSGARISAPSSSGSLLDAAAAVGREFSRIFSGLRLHGRGTLLPVHDRHTHAGRTGCPRRRVWHLRPSGLSGWRVPDGRRPKRVFGAPGVMTRQDERLKDRTLRQARTSACTASPIPAAGEQR